MITLLVEQSEKIAALEDLVEGGANLLQTMDGLLEDIRALGDIDTDSKFSTHVSVNISYSYTGV